jgi:DNA-binding NarL/FixJ family response regulator
MTVPVVLAEAHPVTRAALTALLGEDGDLRVVPTADLGDALPAVVRHGAPVLIVSRRLLERHAAGVRLPERLPAGTRTIVIGLEDDPVFARDARRAGAVAYVVTDRADPELRAALDAVLAEMALKTTLPLSA